jgi:hypothetical protein
MELICKGLINNREGKEFLRNVIAAKMDLCTETWRRKRSSSAALSTLPTF